MRLVVLLVASACLCRPVTAQTVTDEPIIEGNVHGRASMSNSIRGHLEDFFRGSNPTPTYREQLSTGFGIGGSVGYRLRPGLGLHLSLDITRPQGNREGVSFKQTLIQTTGSVRLSPWSSRRTMIPYLGLGVASIYLREANLQSPPWPYTSALSGHVLALTGGVQRRIGARAALDVGFELAGGRFDDVEIEGSIHKASNTGMTVSPRINVGLSWLPPVNDVGRFARDVSAFEVGRVVRIFGDRGEPLVGSVVDVQRDGVVLQTEQNRAFRQIAVPYACVRHVDVHVGERNVARPVLLTAVQGLVLGSTVFLGARWAGAPGIPIKPGPFALAAALPSAAVGAFVGAWRQRSEWAKAPLPAQVSNAERMPGQQRCGRS